MNRVLCTTLLLSIILGYAMGTTHAATHVNVDPGDCTLCATYGSSNDAIAASGTLALPNSRSCGVADLRDVVEPRPSVAPAHPRGPPLSI